jgi:replicative DNA helicase
MGNPIEKELELQEYKGEDRVIPSTELQEELRQGGTKFVTKVNSGIKRLDELVDGFEAGELITISGPTKQGKTSLSHTLTKNFEAQGVYSVWFSFEVTGLQLFEKFAKAKLFYVPRRLKHKSMDWINDRVVESKLKYGTKVVFIDHLHYLVDMERARANMSIEVGNVIRNLKNLARDEEMIIFLMAHLTKTRYDDMPTESDLRDSSFITQESDKTMLIWRERKKDRESKQYKFSGKTLLIVSNDRRTGTMGKYVDLQFENGEFTEYKTEHDKLLDEAIL